MDASIQVCAFRFPQVHLCIWVYICSACVNSTTMIHISMSNKNMFNFFRINTYLLKRIFNTPIIQMSRINSYCHAIFGIKPKIYIPLPDTAYSAFIISCFCRIAIFFPLHNMALYFIIKKIHKLHSNFLLLIITIVTITEGKTFYFQKSAVFLFILIHP